MDVGGDVTAESNLTVTGNLTVNGTTTTVNSTVTTYDDPVITVGGDTAPSTNDGKDRGVEFRYYDELLRKLVSSDTTDPPTIRIPELMQPTPLKFLLVQMALFVLVLLILLGLAHLLMLMPMPTLMAP